MSVHHESPRHEEDGASAVEYGLVLAGIAALITGVVFLFGGAVSDQYDSTCDSVTADSIGDLSCRNP
jgi:pilus assembly protein Flp/PilA